MGLGLSFLCQTYFDFIDGAVRHKKINLSTSSLNYDVNFPIKINILLHFSGVAPDIFKGRCIHPCTKCVQKQVRKVIVALQQNHPKEFNALIRKFRTSGRG